ncbi:hypothetical protein ACCS81_08325 [Rhizobium ruizarguesonis]
MRRSSSLQYKTLDKLVPGELIRLNFGSSQSSLLILLGPDSEGRAVYGVLESPVFETPMCAYRMEGNINDCLSYGKDWFLDEDHGPETMIGGSTKKPCRLFVGPRGVHLVFHPENTRSPLRNRYYYNVEAKTVELGIETNQAAPIPTWRIWESRSHYLRKVGLLFEYSPE